MEQDAVTPFKIKRREKGEGRRSLQVTPKKKLVPAKKRGENFSKQQRKVLLDEVKVHKDIIMASFSTHGTDVNRRKKNVWNKICQNVSEVMLLYILLLSDKVWY